MPDTRHPLRSFDGGGRLRVKRVPLRFMGLPMGTRMTVVRLEDGGLWVHSPIALTPENRKETLAVGPVRHLVAPNRLHHRWIGDWAAALPEAACWASPALLSKRPDVAWTGALGDDPPDTWGGEFEQCRFGGYPWLGEVVFNHIPTRTLIVADLLVSVHPTDPWYYRALGRLAGARERPTLTRDQRFLVRDRAAARAAVERILTWNFDRIVLAHGRLIERDGKRVFAEGMRWLTG